MKALITGAGTGIGAATAVLFDQKGYDVILVGRTRGKLETVASQCKHALVETCDLQDPEQISGLASKVGYVDVLINNAGIIERGEFAKQSLGSWRAQYETNVFGPALLTQAILEYMIPKKSGSIVNVSSSLGIRPIAGASAYSSSKAATISWTQALALELAQHGLRANVVCPGIVETPILTDHKRELSNDERIAMGKLHPLGRLGRPEDIASGIYYLATAEWVTGTVLVIDGGISL